MLRGSYNHNSGDCSVKHRDDSSNGSQRHPFPAWMRLGVDTDLRGTPSCSSCILTAAESSGRDPWLSDARGCRTARGWETKACLRQRAGAGSQDVPTTASCQIPKQKSQSRAGEAGCGAAHAREPGHGGNSGDAEAPRWRKRERRTAAAPVDDPVPR